MEHDATAIDACDIFGAPCLVSYRNVRHPRLEFRTGQLLLVLPKGADAEAVLQRHQTWISMKAKFIEECLQDSAVRKLVKRSQDEFKRLVYTQVDIASVELGVAVNKVLFRKMKTKWASCSTKKNLTVNTLMKHLPGYLIDYVVFHETAHLKEQKHNEKFWKLVSSRFVNHDELEKELFAHWFLVNDHL